MKPAVGEPGTDPGIAERRFQESLSQARPGFVEIVVLAVLFKMNAVIGMAGVFKHRPNYFSNADFLAVHLQFFVDRFKPVSLLYSEEIDLPGVNHVGKLMSERHVCPGVYDGLV